MRFVRLLSVFLGALAFLGSAALAQVVPLQGGPWTAGRVPMYSSSGNSQPVIQDSGPAGGGAVGRGISEGLYVARGTGTPPYAAQGTGPFGTNVCDYDGPVTSAAGYHFLCFSANAQGGGLISYGAGGGASTLPLQINVNGTLAPLSFAAVSPLTISGGNLSLGIDAQFAVVSNKLALASVAGGDLLANATAGSAEPSGVTPSAWLSQWCSLSADQVPYSTGASTWGCLGLLGTSHTWTGTQTFSPSIAVGSGGTGASTFTANAPLIGAGASPVTVGSRSGTTTVFATASGALANGDCVSLNNGNMIDAGGPCTTGGGGGTVTAGTANQLAYYATTAATVSGLASGNNGTLVTDGSGVPSISSTLPSAVQGNITALGTIATGVWHGTAVVPTYGGTGLATLTANAVMLGEGTSNVGFATIGTAGRLFLDQGASADPAFKALSQDCTITSAGVITCTKTNNVSFGTAATTNSTAYFQVANNLSEGTAATERVNLGIGAVLSTISASLGGI